MTFDSLLAQLRDFKAQLKAGIKAELTERVKAVFESDPHIARVAWTQYAPYFNDGDPCNFGVNELQIYFAEEAVDAGDDTDDDDGEEHYLYNLKGTPSYDAAMAFEQLIQNDELSETMETAFGNGVEVSITRSGEVLVEEYEHD